MKQSKTTSYITFGLALCYSIGFVCLLTFFSPLLENQLSKEERIAYYLSNKLSLQFWYLTIYVLFGVLLIPLVSMVKNLFSKISFERKDKEQPTKSDAPTHWIKCPECSSLMF